MIELFSHSCSKFSIITIELITVFDAILPGGQSGKKLQCLHGNPMADNLLQNRSLHNL